MAVDVSVVMCTWNSTRWIRRCLQSFAAQEGVSAELWIVDNGSVDETRSVIAQEAPTARLLHQPRNLGPAVARNLAIHQTQGRYVLSLDPDVELVPGFLRTMVAAADASPTTVGMWTAKVLRMDRTTIDSTGIVLTPTWRAFDRGSGEQDRGQWDQHPNSFLGPSACAGLYRRALLESVREQDMYFDERLFFLWEDVELAWRAAQQGWRARYVPQAVCYHKRNGTDLPRRLRQRLSLRNRYLFLHKHRLFHPWTRYIWRCGWYEIARLGYVAVTNPRAIRAAVGVLRHSIPPYQQQVEPC